MVPLLVVLLLALILFGAGFAVKALWWLAVIVLVVWLLGFVMRSAGTGGRQGRWYRWSPPKRQHACGSGSHPEPQACPGSGHPERTSPSGLCSASVSVCHSKAPQPAPHPSSGPGRLGGDALQLRDEHGHRLLVVD